MKFAAISLLFLALTAAYPAHQAEGVTETNPTAVTGGKNEGPDAFPQAGGSEPMQSVAPAVPPEDFSEPVLPTEPIPTIGIPARQTVTFPRPDADTTVPVDPFNTSTDGVNPDDGNYCDPAIDFCGPPNDPGIFSFGPPDDCEQAFPQADGCQMTQSVVPFPPEPFPTDPYPADPYPADPYPADPYPTDPYPTDPYPTEPFPTDPLPTDPYPTDPYPTDPYPTDPFPTTGMPARETVTFPRPDADTTVPVDPFNTSTDGVNPDDANYCDPEFDFCGLP